MKIEKFNNYWLFFFIFLINILLYSPCINAYFVNDDYNWLKPVSFYDVIHTFWGGWGHGALYRPITRLIFYFEFILFNNSPAGYHITSIIFQSLIIFLFYLLVNNLFKGKNLAIIIPLMLFSFYPFHEVVCWISAQTSLISANFIFLSLLLFLFSLDDHKSYFILLGSLLFYLLALLSYEISVILPFLCLLIAFYLKGGHYLKQKIFYYKLLPYLILTIIYLIFRKKVLQGLPEANEFTLDLQIWLFNFLILLKFQFIENKFLLIPAILSISYFIIFKKEFKYLIFSGLWFLICYIPFLFINGYTGRFAYLSMFGILFFVSIFFDDLYKQYNKYKIWISFIFLVYISFNGFKTYQNAAYWYEAGEIARTIPLQLKELYNSFPDNSTLIFYDIPLGYQQSGIYLTYFEDVIQKQYSNHLNIIHVSHSFNKNFNDSIYSGKANVFKFKYYLDNRQLLEIKQF